ncbi:uncharacterized protein LOC129594206 [Paramacrobiotus metropolitanus]|uniref:uncharacterized protein LOC129594206 n=1 Tax=Paramacrobiotus metropolitanus TaxID=2943436 RepID=UPI0024460276|nr:uncharacterized protein LOC129594206 [Paramacrobiotus metropolitanus]
MDSSGGNGHPSSSTCAPLFILSRSDFELRVWEEDEVQSAVYRTTLIADIGTLKLIRSDDQQHVVIVFSKTTLVDKAGRQSGSDVRISVHRDRWNVSAAEIGISSISSRDVLMSCRGTVPLNLDSYTLMDEKIAENSEEKMHSFLIRFDNCLRRVEFLRCLRNALHGLGKNSFIPSDNNGNIATTLELNSHDSVSDMANPTSGTCATAPDPVTTSANGVQNASEIVLTRKRKRKQNVVGSRKDRRVKLKDSASGISSCEHLNNDVIRYAQLHGCQQACDKFGMDTRDLRDRVFELFSKTGRYSAVNRDHSPSHITQPLLTCFAADEVFLLQKLMEKASELAKAKKPRRPFEPTLKWAARFVLYHNLRNVECNDTEDILRLAEFPLIPPSDAFKILSGGAADAPATKWELRRYFVDFADKTSLRVAAELFNIPKSTLSEWCNKLNGADGKSLPSGSGRAITYSKDADNRLVTWMLQECRRGNKVTVSDLQRKAKEVIGEEIPDFRASRGWVHSFCRRHKVKFPIINGGSIDGVTSQCSPHDNVMDNEDLELFSSVLNELLCDHFWSDATD